MAGLAITRQLMDKPDFVEMGPQMAGLLNQLHSRGVAQAFVAQILAAFPAPQPDLSTVEGPAVSSAPQAEPVEPLTDRELQTL